MYYTALQAVISMDHLGCCFLASNVYDWLATGAFTIKLA